MSWREDLRRVDIGGKQTIGGSFRGVPFLVSSSDRGGGRRVVVHEFPYRDSPFAEDLGRAGRPFRLECYVVGDDYMTQRDALLAALEDVSGPGALVHPYHGLLSVIVGPGPFSCRESTVDGGMAAFAIEFTETPEQEPVPSVVVNAAANVAASANAANTAADAEFVEAFDSEDMPSFGLASAESALVEATERMGELLAPAVTSTQELATLNGKIQLMTVQAGALVRAPAGAVAAFLDVIRGLEETAAAAPGAMMTALLDSYLVPLGDLVDPTTATRERERANQVAIMAAIRRVMVAEAARLAPLVPYESTDEAMTARDRIATALDEQAAGATDTAYPAIADLRSSVMRAVPGDSTFASIVEVERKQVVPSLLLAYQLYGSVDAEADIVARNAVPHPGFVAGVLKVLSDG